MTNGINLKKRIYFVSGIDTDAGKSYATGYLAKTLNANGMRTITQKFIQTGNIGRSEDIELHRKIMGTGMTDEDRDLLTMPEIFSYPASPLLASAIDKRPIDFAKINDATRRLAGIYDIVLVEGAGGLMVPLTENMLTIDFILDSGYPVIFVTSGKLGSVNHTLLSFEALESRGIEVAAVMYNLFPEIGDTTIREDTENYIRKYMDRHFPDAQFIKVPVIRQERDQAF